VAADVGAIATAAAPTVKSTAQAIYVSLQLVTGAADVAGTGAEAGEALEQLQQLVEELGDVLGDSEAEAAGKPLQPPPGIPNFRF
jgi:hypothetical protein